jgi:hypothetical protein
LLTLSGVHVRIEMRHKYKEMFFSLPMLLKDKKPRPPPDPPPKKKKR